MDDALKKRLNELALRSVHSGRPCFTRFLEPSALSEANASAGSSGAGIAL